MNQHYDRYHNPKLEKNIRDNLYSQIEKDRQCVVCGAKKDLIVDNNNWKCYDCLRKETQ